MKYEVLKVEGGWSVFRCEPDTEPVLIPHTNEVGEIVPYIYRQAAYRRKKQLEGARAMIRVNVWVKEAFKGEEGQSYLLMEKTPRAEAVQGLNETILDGGKVPAWIESINFYESGDFPTETYSVGDTIK